MEIRCEGVGGNMQVGDLVKYISDNDLGIIIDKTKSGKYRVKWNDDCDGWYNGRVLEVICE